MSFLTPETYPNYQLSHHPFSFPLTVEKKGNPRLHYSSIFPMFAAALAAVCKLSFQTTQLRREHPYLPLLQHTIWTSRWSLGTE